MDADRNLELQALDAAAQYAKDWLSGLEERPLASTVDLVTLRSRLERPLPTVGCSSESVVQELVELTEGGLLGSASGRFFAWVIGGAVPSALAADWLVATWDQNAALFDCSPAAAVVEEVAGDWLKDLLELPPSASFALTTGCQLAHMTGLAAARYRVLERTGWCVANDGLFGAPPIRVLVNEQKHGSVDKALRYLGIGSRSMQVL